jgi:hypothetical protein
MLGLGWWEDGTTIEVLPITLTCEPVLQNRETLARALAAARHVAHADGRTEATPATFQLAIIADGSVRYSQLIQGTGVASVDSALRAIVKQMRFSPPIMGTEPVRVIRTQKILLRGLQ